MSLIQLFISCGTHSGNKAFEVSEFYPKFSARSRSVEFFISLDFIEAEGSLYPIGSLLSSLYPVLNEAGLLALQEDALKMDVLDFGVVIDGGATITFRGTSVLSYSEEFNIFHCKALDWRVLSSDHYIKYPF